MLDLYQTLIDLALAEYSDIVTHAHCVGGTSASPNKLRLVLFDGSFLDIWLSPDRDYAYHWERRRQRGQLYRWDNAPHHPHVDSFPAHFHEGDQHTVVASDLDPSPEIALRQVLNYIRERLT